MLCSDRKRLSDLPDIIREENTIALKSVTDVQECDDDQVPSLAVLVILLLSASVVILMVDELTGGVDSIKTHGMVTTLERHWVTRHPHFTISLSISNVESKIKCCLNPIQSLAV